MIKFALLGAGRIGKMHANNISLNPLSDLEILYDINRNASKELSDIHNCKIAKSAEEAINNEKVEIYYKQFLKGKNHHYKLWALIVFELWNKKYREL